MRAEHRLHAGAARRAAAADGARRGRTSTTTAAGSRPPASIPRWSSRSPTSSRRRSSAAPTPRATRSRRSTPARWRTRRSCRSAPSTGARMVIISPNDPAAMVQYAEECRTLRIPFIWDPGQQCARMSGDELADGIDGSAIVICNDYEFELIKQKTGLDEDGVFARTGALIVTRGENGSHRRATARRTRRPGRAAAPHRRSDRRRRRVPRRPAQGTRDRRGPRSRLPARQCGGDLRARASWRQSHAYTWEEFRARYRTHFGPLVASAFARALPFLHEVARARHSPTRRQFSGVKSATPGRAIHLQPRSAEVVVKVAAAALAATLVLTTGSALAQTVRAGPEPPNPSAKVHRLPQRVGARRRSTSPSRTLREVRRRSAAGRFRRLRGRREAGRAVLRIDRRAAST